MSSNSAQLAGSREALREQQRKAPLLRDLYPALVEVQVAFHFEDGTPVPPSVQRFSYFSAARCLFRYACPCHSCDGQFDIVDYIAGMAGRQRPASLTQRISVACEGQRLRAPGVSRSCPVLAHVEISAYRRAEDSSDE